MRIGIVTSGGDCPGLNAVIRGAVLHGEESFGHSFVGFRGGWRGVALGDVVPLSRQDVKGISGLGGTIIGTSRTNPWEFGGESAVRSVMRSEGVDAIMAIGGDGTLAVAHRLHENGIPVVGVPKTVDNDLNATDMTFGFDTAVSIATEAMDRLRTTGDSHGRCMVAEVMGRHAGWIALHSGMAAGAHAILIPERRTTLDQLMRWVESARDRGRAPLVVVAEGFILGGETTAYSTKGDDAFGRPRLGGIGDRVATAIEQRSGVETRATLLGHIQRGGVPTSFDRVLATRFGIRAVELCSSRSWGTMVALRGTDVHAVSLSEALGVPKLVPEDRYLEAAGLFG